MKWKQWHYRHSIKTKMLVLVLSVTLISIMLMALFSSYYYSESAKKDFYLLAEDSTSRINHQLDLYFNQLAQTTYSSIAGPLQTNPLFGTSPENGLLQEWLSSGHSFSLEKTALLEEMLSRHIAINYSSILGIVLRAQDNRIVYSKDHSLNNSMKASGQWLSGALTDRLLVVPSYFSRHSASSVPSYPFITLVVPIFDPNKLQLNGNLYMALSITEIQNILGQAKLGKTGYFFIVDANGEIVFHPDVNLVGKLIEDTAMKGVLLTSKNSTIRVHGKKVLVSSNHSEMSGWSVIAYVPLDEMATGLGNARNSTVMIMTGIILISLILIYRIANWITRPILGLRNLMKLVESGNLTVQAPVIPGSDEIQQLNGSFNRMTRSLSELIHTVNDLQMKEMHLQLRQKDALIQALQNQINPHLLYNTLEIIKSIAFIEKVPTIEKMATRLASVYRYSSKMPGSEVMLKDEVTNLRNYLDIIHIRFGDKFKSKIDVDERYMDCRIVKLSLQPIVENSVKYAVEPKNGHASIRITAYEEGEDLIIMVTDTGDGFPPHILRSLNAKMQFTGDQAAELAKEESVGLLNVHARLFLNYGSPYGICIRNGNVVTLRYPKKIN